MPVRYYPIILERGSEGLHATFPDLPGLIAFGETKVAVTANAEAGLALHIAGMIEDGVDIPEPSDIDQVPADPEVEEAGRLLVRGELPGRAVRVNVTFDEALLAAIDAEAKRRDTSRAGFLAAAARREIAQQGNTR